MGDEGFDYELKCLKCLLMFSHCHDQQFFASPLILFSVMDE